MTLKPHMLPRSLFDAIAAGGGGSAAMSALAAAQYSKHLIVLRGIVKEAEAAGADQAELARYGYDLLTEIQQQDRRTVDQVLRYPAVGAWALRTLRALRDSSHAAHAEPARLCAVVAAAAVSAGVEAEIAVRPVGGTVMLPSLGAARIAAPAAIVRIAADGAAVDSADTQVKIPQEAGQDMPGWLPIRHIRTGEFDAIVDDLDPFRMPAVPGLAARLSAREMSSWQAAIEPGWRLLTSHHPAIAEEFRAAVAVIVPLARPAQGLVSSSSAETFGAIALSEPPDPWTCAVTFAHELQHLKLSALLDLCGLTLPDDGRRYYAPWRPDPRPLSGLLQGTYAYLGVCAFWRHEREFTAAREKARADQEFALWRTGVARAIERLHSSGQLTVDGVDFINQMAKTVSSWQGDAVPPAARDSARYEARRHMDRWERAHGPLPA